MVENSYYERKIKYLDLMESGERTGSAGFVKIEVKGMGISLLINVKGLHPTDTYEREVILQTGESEIPVGRIALKEGQGQFQYQMVMDHTQLQGIRIALGGTREICCKWQEIKRAMTVEKKVMREETVQETRRKDSGKASLRSEASVPGFEASGHGSEASVPGSEAFSHGSEASVPGSEASGHGSETSVHGFEASVPGTEASGHGFEASVHGSEASNPGTEASIPGSETSVPGSEASGSGAEASISGSLASRHGSEAFSPELEMSGHGSDTSGHGSDPARGEIQSSSQRPKEIQVIPWDEVKAVEESLERVEKILPRPEETGSWKTTEKTARESKRPTWAAEMAARGAEKTARETEKAARGGEKTTGGAERAARGGEKTARGGEKMTQEAQRITRAAERTTEKTARTGKRPASGSTMGSAKRPVRLMEDKWQQIWAIYPHIHPFQDEREYLSISPADFVLLPDEAYRAANNSFLLHGYYNYDHLILTKIEKRGEVSYYIGVPGNYYEREKQVAVMFGFESFECGTEPAQAGDFGYYMMRTQL